MTNMAADFHQNKQTGWGGKGWPARRKPEPFCNLIYQVTSHDFCYILITRNGLLGPAHTQTGGGYQRREYHESGLSGGPFRGCLPQRVFADHHKNLGAFMPLNRSLLLPVCLAKRIMGISRLPAETRIGPTGPGRARVGFGRSLTLEVGPSLLLFGDIRAEAGRPPVGLWAAELCLTPWPF